MNFHDESVTERARRLLDRIADLDRELHAYVAVDRERVLAAAALLDALPPQERGPLHGTTLAVKDLIDVEGYATRAGSSFFERVPTDDAPVVARLRAAGALVIGKTNTHEFAWGITTENPHFGRTENPWDRARIVGGSSGGAGAAIAGDLAELALGTDTLGSIRIPSALCGITGLRPAIGSISTVGIVPLAPALDTVGPMARDVATVAAAYRVLGGVLAPPSALRICRLRGAAWESVEPALLRALDDVVARARDFAEPLAIDDVAWWDDALSAATSHVQHGSVKAENFHAPLFARAADRYGEDVRERVALALAIDDRTVDDARATIANACRSWNAALREYDLAIAPIVPGEAPLAPAPKTFRQATIPFAAPASAFGLPALTVPIGFSPAGLPLGMQVIALDGEAATVLAFGDRYQRATDWHLRRAPI